MTKRTGFTLAEVLITLGIIGVVAAMTIPTLMNQTSQIEFKTGFKKMLSTLNQAVTMNVALNNTDFSLLGTGTAAGSNSVYEMFTTRMNVINTANADQTTTGLIDYGVTNAKMSSGTANYVIFFNDGMALAWPTSMASCIDNGLTCDAIVDVNGSKKPNRLTNCATSSTAATDTATAGTCTSSNLVIGDRFSVRFGGQSVQANGPGARYVMYN